MRTRPRTISPLDPLMIAGDAEATAERIVLPQAPEASALSRPAAVGSFWVEKEYDELEAEQGPLWAASGEEAARPSRSAVAGLTLTAEATEFLVQSHIPLVEAAQQRLADTLAALAPYRRRAKGTKIWYQLAKLGFLLGDLAGFATAAIWLGEEIFIALTLALSAAVATVAAGLVGTEVRDLRGRRLRQRPLEDLTEQQQQFPHLFTANDAGASIVMRVVQVSAVTAGMIGVGIAALRATVDDPIVGLVFGGIALAVAGGSFLVSYAGADEVADLIDNTDADYTATIAEHSRIAADPSWQQRAAEQVVADGILAEHAQRGAAAQSHIRALKWRVLRLNPHIAGHGAANPAASTTVGRSTRREDS